MEPILEIQSLSKKFNIHHENGAYLSLREKLSDLVKFNSSKTKDEEFWALKDVSFNVMHGESIGIIGKNGAGKSTLLKILSKITPPTSGKIITRGRIASLLEVGTGFHPELTGRENVFLNGSILGMRKREIDVHFDEIIDFAGTEKFLDTPLKHYSSGMQLRLAFAVAAFLEPEVLVIDEVLAVGDLEFQKKCLGKMDDVTKSGRTLLFVSHQLGMVRQLCSKALLLDNGAVLSYGKVDAVLDDYTQFTERSNEFINTNNDQRKIYSIEEVKSLNAERIRCSNFAHDEDVILKIEFVSYQELRNTHLLAAVNNRNGQRIFSSDIALDNYKIKTNERTIAYLTLPKETLAPGNYTFFLGIHCPNTIGYDVKDHICPITIFDNGSEFAPYENRWFYGDVFVKCDWQILN